MTVFSVSHTGKVLACVMALGLSFGVAAEAGDRHHDHRRSAGRSGEPLGGMVTEPLRRHGHDWRHERVRPKYGHAGRRDGRRDWRDGGAFYGGAISVYRDRGNGRYLYVENDGPYRERRDGSYDHRGSDGRVIEVAPGRNGCAFESGVCVIRR